MNIFDEFLAIKESTIDNLKNSSIKQKKCAVCGCHCFYHYYGVQSCEGCKEFFRRVIVRQKFFRCAKMSECQIANAAAGKRCRGCRLDKCLLVGMLPSLVNVERTSKLELFLLNLEQLRVELLAKHYRQLDQTDSGQKMGQMSDHSQQQQMLLSIPATEADHLQVLNPLLFLVQCHQRIWMSADELEPKWLERDYTEYLGDSCNILARANTFSKTAPTFWNKSLFIAQAEEFAFNFPLYAKITVRSRFLGLELMRALLFVRRLSAQDQDILLRQMGPPVCLLLNCQYAVQMGSTTWTENDGTTLICAKMTSRLRDDASLNHICKQIFCDTVASFVALDLDAEEFAMLLALLVTSSNAAQLSPPARELLYDESVRHSKALFRLLQAKVGSSAAPGRQVQLMGLLYVCHRVNSQLVAMITHLDLFHEKGSFFKKWDEMWPKTIFPK